MKLLDLVLSKIQNEVIPEIIDYPQLINERKTTSKNNDENNDEKQR